jgi:hypothetical protein
MLKLFIYFFYYKQTIYSLFVDGYLLNQVISLRIFTGTRMRLWIIHLYCRKIMDRVGQFRFAKCCSLKADTRCLVRAFFIHKTLSFTVSTMTCLTVTVYLCHKWQWICSPCRTHFPVLSLFMTYHQVCNWGN